MHDASINVAEANRNFASQQEELHPNGHQVGKYVNRVVATVRIVSLATLQSTFLKTSTVPN